MTKSHRLKGVGARPNDPIIGVIRLMTTALRLHADGLGVCEKTGIATGQSTPCPRLSSKRPPPVPIFSQPLSRCPRTPKAFPKGHSIRHNRWRPGRHSVSGRIGVLVWFKTGTGTGPDA